MFFVNYKKYNAILEILLEEFKIDFRSFKFIPGITFKWSFFYEA